MLLSLEMLAYDLQASECEAVITSSKRTLAYPYLNESEVVDDCSISAKTLSEKEHLSKSLKEDELRCSQAKQGVICECAQGYLFFKDQSLMHVFNKIQKCFRFYNEWEFALAQLFFKNSKWQQLVDILESAYKNPLYIVNRYGRMLALTDTYAEEPITEDWLIIAKDKALNFSAYDMMKVYPLKKEPTLVNMAKEENGCNYIQAALLPDDPYNHVLYVLEWTHELGIRDMHLTEAVQEIVSHIDLADYGYVPVTSVFEELISGTLTDMNTLNWALVQLDWQDKESFALFGMQKRAREEKWQDGLMAGQLLRRLPKCACFQNGDTILVIVPSDKVEESQRTVLELVGMKDYFCGVSLDFSNWLDLPLRHKEVRYAISFAKDTNTKVVLCKDHLKDMLPYVYDEFYGSSDKEHPLIPQLTTHDKTQGTDLLETMYIYLSNERNASVAAKHLNIHRNTLTYRLSTIDALMKVDWNNPMERIHFLLSYKARNNHQ